MLDVAATTDGVSAAAAGGGGTQWSSVSSISHPVSTLMATDRPTLSLPGVFCSTVTILRLDKLVAEE